jgi:hypothetical protein
VGLFIGDYQRATYTFPSALQINETISDTSPGYRGCIVEAAATRSSSAIALSGLSFGPRAEQQVSNVRSFHRISPASVLEGSHNFCPERYANQARLPDLLIATLYEKSFNGTESVNIYRVLWLQNSRTWIHINVSLELPISSTYWQFTRISKKAHPNTNPRSTFCMPLTLLGRLCQELNALEYVEEDTHIHLQADRHDREVAIIQIDLPSRQIASILTDQRTEQAILGSVYHMGCARVNEREVARLACIEPPSRFLSFFNGHLVQEIMSPDRPPRPSFCYNVQLLQQLRHEHGFGHLAGVVIDNDMVKSFLVKWPDTACALLLQRAGDLSLSHPWSQIEDWSRQLLHRLLVVHSVGGVVGSLRYTRPPILVDANNQLHLWHFDTRVIASRMASPFYPPEFRYLSQKWHDNGNCASQTEECLVTPAYDVYQCGQLLWMLAAGWASADDWALKDKNAPQLKEDFYRSPKGHQGLWFGSDPLPRLPSQVPSWFQSVVDACCADVHARPSCKDILKLFPTEVMDTSPGQLRDHGVQPQDTKTMRIGRLRFSSCDHCRQQITDIEYTCNICQAGDIDICPACFLAGKHCDNSEHLLIEVNFEERLAGVTRYHSSVNAAGKKKMYAL